jgi:enterochelin esterase-like enzyme
MGTTGSWPFAAVRCGRFEPGEFCKEPCVLRRSLLICLLAACLFGFSGHSLAGTITHYTFDSDVLGREYSYNVYLPDGYNTGDLAYPVLYLLHGSGGNENDWPVYGKVQSTVDYLIEEGAIPPTIIVMPGSKSWWVDGYNEDAETAFFSDLVPHIETTFSVISDRSGRLVAGLSAGGYGTINFVLEYPDMFAAGAALSPASYVPYPPTMSSANRHPAFQDTDGKFDKELWRRLNYTQHIDSYKAQDLVVPLYINSGDHDSLDIAFHAAVLFQSLREHQPDLVEFRVVDGGHDWEVWSKTLSEALAYIFRFSSRPEGKSQTD